MAGVELGGAQLRMAFQIEAAGLHEAERLGNAVGQFDVAARLRTVLDEAEHPLPHARQIGVAALRKGAQKIERRRRLAIGGDLPARIGVARLLSEGDVVDDVAAVARQFLAVALFGRRGAWLGELAGDAADLHHRRSGGISEHHRHLQEHAEEVTDIVGAVFGEAFRAVATLQQESLAVGDARKLLLQTARLAREHQRRERGKLLLGIGQYLQVRIIRHLLDRLLAPTIRRPTLGHSQLLQRLVGVIHEGGPPRPAIRKTRLVQGYSAAARP